MNDESVLRCQLVAGPKELAGKALLDLGAGELTARLIDGSLLQSEMGIFTTFAGALQFPWYFGHNWHAFDESFGELAEEELGSGLGLVIMNSERLDPTSSGLRSLIASLRYAGDDWSQLEQPLRLAVVLQYDGEIAPEMEAAWRAAGVEFDS